MTLKMNLKIIRGDADKIFELALELDARKVMYYIQLLSFLRICSQLAMVLLFLQIASDVLVGPLTSIVLHSLLLGLSKGIELYCRQEMARGASFLPVVAEAPSQK